MYILYQRIDAWADCDGPNKLGPHLTSAVFAYNLKDISTLVVENGALTGKRQLTLEDIQAASCSTIPYDQEAAWSNTLPATTDTSYRCYPRIAIPTNVLDFGQPWWSGCGIFNPSTGIIDPPSALSIVAGLQPVSPVAPQATSTDSGGILFQTSPIPYVPTTTAPVPVNTPAPVVPVNTGSAASSTPAPVAQPVDSGSGNSPTAPDTPTTQDPAPAAGGNTVASVSVSVIATNVIAAPPQGSGNQVTGGGATDQDPSNQDVAVPVIPETDDSTTSSPAADPVNPDTSDSVAQSQGGTTPNTSESDDPKAPAAIAGIPVPASAGSNSAASTPQPEKVVYKSLTPQIGGPVVTISSLNAVVTYGTDGVIVQYPNGVQTTVRIAARPTTSGVSASIPTFTNPLNNANNIGAVINSMMNGSPAKVPTSTHQVLSSVSSQGTSSTTAVGAGNSPAAGLSKSLSSQSTAKSRTSSSSTSSLVNAGVQPTTGPTGLFTGFAHRSRRIDIPVSLALCSALLVLLL